MRAELVADRIQCGEHEVAPVPRRDRDGDGESISRVGSYYVGRVTIGVVIGGIILAAGGSSRFGGRKQLAELGGRPLVEHAVEALRAVPALDRIVVVLGADAEDVRRGADLSGTEIVVADEWGEGIAASLRAGVAALAEAGAERRS